MQESDAKSQPASASSSQLWVDKYRPTSYMGLLSDEGVNFDVLRWVKSWDPLVFGTAAPGTNRRKGIARAFKPLNSAPEHRILLIGGPPGLGKTTLAHTVAKHCGYRAVEINASDDRTAAVFRDKLKAATEMTAVLGSKKPNCVIIDEIDGAAGGGESKGAVAMLLKLTQELGSNLSVGNKKRRQQPVNRPIIAICNDLYAPVLRPLRAAAKVVTFKQAKASRIAQRLHEIARKENLGIQRNGVFGPSFSLSESFQGSEPPCLQALWSLAEQSGCDMRSCINTMQFLARQGGQLSMSRLLELNIGNKDARTHAFDVWARLLSSKANNASAQIKEEEEIRFLLGDFGEHDLVLNGLHENALTQGFFDPFLERICEVYDKLLDADLLLTMSRRTSNFGVLAYVPSTFLSVRRVVAKFQQRAKLQWPKAQAEAGRMAAGNSALIESWISTLHPSVGSMLTVPLAVTEIIPCLIRAVSRPLRAVPQHAFTPEERSTMAGMIEVMNAYGITFDMAIDQTAQDSCVALKPEIHRLLHYPSYKQAAPRQMAYAVRLILVHQAHITRLSQKARLLGERSSPDLKQGRPLPQLTEGEVSGSQAGVNNATSGTQEGAGKRILLSVAQRAQQAGVTDAANPKKKKEPRALNWLEKMRNSKAQQQPGARKKATEGSRDAGASEARVPVVRYKFSEGYTNAIKRPLLMDELL